MPVTRVGHRNGVPWKVVSVRGQGVMQHFFQRSTSMRISEHAMDLIREFETCELEAYPDPRSALGIECSKRELPMRSYRRVPTWLDLSGTPWTIGWGATGPGITQGTKWTQLEADRRLESDVAEREVIVSNAVTVPLTQGQFDAMVSIVLNVGAGSKTRSGIIRLNTSAPSTLLRLLNAGDKTGAAAEFDRWTSGGMKGLVRRRAAERALFEGKT